MCVCCRYTKQNPSQFFGIVIYITFIYTFPHVIVQTRLCFREEKAELVVERECGRLLWECREQSTTVGGKKKVIEYCSHFLDLPMQILTVCVTRMSEYMSTHKCKHVPAAVTKHDFHCITTYEWACLTVDLHYHLVFFDAAVIVD